MPVWIKTLPGFGVTRFGFGSGDVARTPGTGMMAGLVALARNA